MQIISHRGLWYDFAKESNQRIAFERSFDKGFGTETDLRDICGKIVISHNMPEGDEITFSELLELMDGRTLPLALNIKADGMIDEIKKILTHYEHTNYFTFDMSIPDMVVQMNKNVCVYTGCSDILNPPVLLGKAQGVWLDSFNSEWFDENIVKGYLLQEKKVCIVSADLHQRDVLEQWDKIKNFSCLLDNNIMLCTDEPEQAKNYFGM